MPIVNNTKDWEKVFRRQVREIAEGWTVRLSPRSNKITLKVRTNNKEESTILKNNPKTNADYLWEESETGGAYARIRNIYALMMDGNITLAQAAKLAESDAPKLVEKLNWQEAKDNFKTYKIKFGNAIKESQWDNKYEPVLSDAIKLLTSNKPPNDPAKLIDKCILHHEAGSRSREIKVGVLWQFLEYCFQRENFPPSWLPKTNRKEHIGKKPADWKSNSKDAVTDQEIINLINNLPESDKDIKDAIKLISLLGLRPIELKHLSVRKDKETNELYWWCDYQKKSSKGTTKPRELHELELVDSEGNIQKWNMLQRWNLKDVQLPNIDNVSGAAGSLSNLLRRRNAWKSLNEIVKDRGENLGLYSLRHSYSLRGTVRGIDSGSLADGMGHEIRTHEEAYQKSSKITRRAAFEKAQKALELLTVDLQ